MKLKKKSLKNGEESKPKQTNTREFVGGGGGEPVGVVVVVVVVVFLYSF